MSYEQARAALKSFGERLTRDYPATYAGMGFTMTPLTDLYGGDVRLYLWPLAAAVGFVLLIACGNVAHLLLAREREIGVRMEMGARTRDVLRLVIGQGARLIALGLGAGLVVAFAAARLMTNLLYLVSAVDPMTFALAPLLLAEVAIAACYLPARRATKVDSIVALRCE